nr:hypothetical protein [Candidatus Krumholzibacteria bacterium]
MNRSRAVRLVIALVVLGVSGWLMRGYTTDDTYIHLRYAHNLIERGEFSFNPGSSSYGATSPLWIFGLALLLKLGLSPFLSAWLLGVISGLSVVLFLDLILEKMTFSGLWRAMLLMLAVSDPWFLRWTFSGMETPLATLLLLVLLFPLCKASGFVPEGGSTPLWPRYLGWGAAAGLASLTRPEFILLAPAALPWLLMFEYFRAGSLGGFSGRYWARPHRPILAAVTGWLAVCLPWFIYAYLAFGRITPGTASAKSSALTFDPSDLVRSLWQSTRTLAVGQGILWIVVLLLIILVLYKYRDGGRHRSQYRKNGWEHWRRDQETQVEENVRSHPGTGDWSIWGPVTLIGVAATWVVVLLGGYAVKQVWIISRYLSPLSPVILLALGVLAEWILGGAELGRQSRRTGAGIIIAGVTLTFLMNIWVVGSQVVPHAQSFPQGVKECYLGLGEWLKASTPEGTVVAALDIGAVGYASDRPVLDLMGLVSPEILAVGGEMGFQEMVEQAAWLGVRESTTGHTASYLVDRSEGVPRWANQTIDGVHFELLDTCTIEGLGLREPQPWTVALYRLVSADSRVKSSAGG